MTTIDAAKCVGMEKEVGSLEVGKRGGYHCDQSDES